MMQIVCRLAALVELRCDRRFLFEIDPIKRRHRRRSCRKPDKRPKANRDDFENSTLSSSYGLACDLPIPCTTDPGK
jgi:hypothetical protein